MKRIGSGNAAEQQVARAQHQDEPTVNAGGRGTHCCNDLLGQSLADAGLRRFRGHGRSVFPCYWSGKSVIHKGLLSDTPRY